jgi:hypothetical protein
MAAAIGPAQARRWAVKPFVYSRPEVLTTDRLIGDARTRHARDRPCSIPVCCSGSARRLQRHHVTSPAVSHIPPLGDRRAHYVPPRTRRGLRRRRTSRARGVEARGPEGEWIMHGIGWGAPPRAWARRVLLPCIGGGGSRSAAAIKTGGGGPSSPSPALARERQLASWLHGLAAHNIFGRASSRGRSPCSARSEHERALGFRGFASSQKLLFAGS